MALMGTSLGLGARFKGLKASLLGPELSAAANSGSWTLSGTTPPTQNGTGIHFVAASNVAAASYNPTPNPLKDNSTYEVTFTIANLTGGNVRVLLYGSTNNHLGTGTTRSANGTYTERLTLTGATTAFLNQIRIQATGAGTTNTFDITSISVKEVQG